jgi:hypothetical protein
MGWKPALKPAASAVLGAAALVGGGDPWITSGFLAFGLLNVWLPARGTAAIRTLGAAAAVAALLGSGSVRALIAVISWLLWPPAIAVAWGLAQSDAGDDHTGRRSRLALAAIIASVAVASFSFRLIVWQNLQQTAALFIGVPAILAIVVALVIPPRSAVGVAIKAVTVGLLTSLIFLGEGILCVLMSAPLFYLIAIAVARTTQRMRAGDDHPITTLFSCSILLALIPMSLEGVADLTTVNRAETISVTRVVDAPAAEVGRVLFDPPRFERTLPLFLRANFPSPVRTSIDASGGAVRWVIEVRGGETRLNGLEARSGDLVLQLVEHTPGLVRWHAISDTSHVRHFLAWREAAVEWSAVDDRTTRVTWTLRYDRGLDPAWYFGPWERYAVRLAAGYLIEAVATP